MQSLEAVLAVDMEALEQFGVFEGIKAEYTGQLVLQLLEGLLGNSLGFSDYSVWVELNQLFVRLYSVSLEQLKLYYYTQLSTSTRRYSGTVVFTVT
jgi:hypothetical protein